MAEIVRDAVRAWVTRQPRQAPPGAGEFASGLEDTAERADDGLRGWIATTDRRHFEPLAALMKFELVP